MKNLLEEVEIVLADPAEEAGLPTAALRSELRRLGTAPMFAGGEAWWRKQDKYTCGGYGSGYGASHDDGYDAGYGYAHSLGSGSGDGFCYGAGDGGGYGHGDGDGRGNGHGDGNGGGYAVSDL